MNLSSGIVPEIRKLSPQEWENAFPIIKQLRRSLDDAEFLQRVRRQSFSGYELVGAFQGDLLIGVMGIRPVHTLARGAHLHVDDLVVDEKARGSGAGKALMGICGNQCSCASKSL